jgi:outer membrane protein assembly factor BamB
MRGSGGFPTRPVALVGRGVVLALTVALAGCWPAPAQGPDRSAYNPFETVITPGTVGTLAPVWTATTDGAADGRARVGPPVVSNVGVHVSDGGSLYGFGLATGARLWRHPDPPLGASFGDPVADPVADGDRVLFSAGVQVGYSGSWAGEATWLDARTGASGQTVADGPVLARRGARMVTRSAVGSSLFIFHLSFLHVVDTADPAAGWTGTLRSGAPGGPPATLGGQRVYVAGTATDSYVPAVESTGVRAYPLTPPETCAESPPAWPISAPIPCPLWFTPTASQPVTSPVLGPGETTLYVGTGDGTLLAVDAGDGHELWRAPLGAAPSADPALAEGRLYVPLSNGQLVVIPADGCGRATCRPAWRAELGAAAVQPAVAGGVVFVGTDAGRALALPAAGCGRHRCRPLWERDMGGAVTGAPAVTGGRLYLGVAPDRLVALAPAGLRAGT